MIPRVAAALLLVAVLVVSTTAGAAATLTVRPGASFPVVVGGFGAGVAVTLRQVGVPGGQTRAAGPDGVVRTTWRAPRQEGGYRLLVIGAPRLSGSRGPGSVLTVVPRLVTIPFRVRRPGPPGGGSGDQGVQGNQGGGGTAHTGTDFAGLLGIGDLLLVAGIALLAVGLRRRRSAAP